MAKLVRPEDFKNRVLMTSPTSPTHTEHIQHYVDMGFDEIHLHNVGRNQAEFIEAFGKRGPAAAQAGLRAGRGPTARPR